MKLSTVISIVLWHKSNGKTVICDVILHFQWLLDYYLPPYLQRFCSQSLRTLVYRIALGKLFGHDWTLQINQLFKEIDHHLISLSFSRSLRLAQ